MEHQSPRSLPGPSVIAMEVADVKQVMENM